MSTTSEKGTENYHGIGQHIDANRGPNGLNSGQRSIVRNPESITPLSYEEALRKTSRQGMSVPKERK